MLHLSADAIQCQHVMTWGADIACLWDINAHICKKNKNIWFVPDKLVIIKESCVFDQTEVLLHSVDKWLNLQVGHLVQWEEADASKHIQQVAGMQVESLQILKTPEWAHTHKQDTWDGMKKRVSLPDYLQRNEESETWNSVSETL